MIISVRGTSGSGKTHLARKVMEKFSERTDLRRDGHKQELGYDYAAPSQLRVVGRYNVASGGVDRVDGRELVFDLIESGALRGNVFYEGLLIANEVTRTLALARAHPTHVIFLDTPLADCLAAINARRALRGVMEPVSPKNTEDKHREMTRIRDRLRTAQCPGMTTYLLGREAAYLKVCELLGIGTPE